MVCWPIILILIMVQKLTNIFHLHKQYLNSLLYHLHPGRLQVLNICSSPTHDRCHWATSLGKTNNVFDVTCLWYKCDLLFTTMFQKKKVKCIKIDGKTPLTTREALVTDFQNKDDIKAAVVCSCILCFLFCFAFFFSNLA